MNDSSSLDLQAAQRLYSAAVAVGMRPVDALVEQALHERDPQWAVRAAQGTAPDIIRLLAEGSLGEIDRVRVHSKAGFHESSTVRERNAALLVYALTIAAALDRFGALLTSQGREELDTLLAGVARCVPHDWAALLDRAIVRHGRVRAGHEQRESSE